VEWKKNAEIVARAKEKNGFDLRAWGADNREQQERYNDISLSLLLDQGLCGCGGPASHPAPPTAREPTSGVVEAGHFSNRKQESQFTRAPVQLEHLLGDY